MSICTDCYDSGAYIDLCATSLLFGTVTPETEYLIMLQSVSTGKVQTFTGTSDEDGVLEFTEPKLASNTTYELWVTTGATNAERVPITVDSVEYECITFSVVSTGVEPEVVELTPLP
jgi:hypothetical protein